MALPEGVTHWDGPPLEAWKPWAPDACARVLAGFSDPWCVVGGWALDLGLGGRSRSHDDLEVAITRDLFPAIRAHLEKAGCVMHAVGGGQVRRLAAGALPGADTHQNWALDLDANAWRVDVMLEPGDAETWVFRRDARIRAPRAFMVEAHGVAAHGVAAHGRAAQGVAVQGVAAQGVVAHGAGAPHLRAHGVLLYKAKAARAKDEADFARAAPSLGRDERAWLIEALGLVHPGHAWIDALTR